MDDIVRLIASGLMNTDGSGKGEAYSKVKLATRLVCASNEFMSRTKVAYKEYLNDTRPKDDPPPKPAEPGHDTRSVFALLIKSIASAPCSKETPEPAPPQAPTAPVQVKWPPPAPVIPAHAPEREDLIIPPPPAYASNLPVQDRPQSPPPPGRVILNTDPLYSDSDTDYGTDSDIDYSIISDLSDF